MKDLAISILKKLSKKCASLDLVFTREETEIIRIAFNLSPYPEYKSWTLLSDCAVSVETYTWTNREIDDKMNTVLDILLN